MFLLTRETRFGIGGVSSDLPTNTHAGFPTPTGFGQYFSLRTTLGGELDTDTGYLRNIKDIDHVIRRDCIPSISNAIQQKAGPWGLTEKLFNQLRDAWPAATLVGLELSLSPFLTAGCLLKEYPMVRLSQKFEFSAAHRLHNPNLSEAENRSAYGKCNNPLGHGHNYELQVTLVGKPDAHGLLIEVPAFEKIVSEAVIERFDHKFLNQEVPEFRELIPSVENIAMVIYRLLKPEFNQSTSLASVTVWETPKTWCEYFE